MRWSLVALASSAFVLGGCQNPLVGTWRSEDQVGCFTGGLGDIEFEIEDNDLKGEGELCNLGFDVDAEDKGNDEYELDFDAKDGTFQETVDCELQDEELECDFAAGRINFEKRD